MNVLDTNNIVKKVKYGEVMLWTMFGTFNKYCMSFEPELLNNGLRKFYLYASAMTKNDIILCDVWAKMLKTGKPV
jgi:hypothetical protein